MSMIEKTLYIIDKSECINEIKDKMKNGDIVITFDSFAKESLRKNGINITPVSKYVTHDINKKGMWWLKDWADKKIIDGSSFKEFCVYNGVSYWWFCDFFLWYHVLHKKNFYSLFYYTDIVLNCIEKEKIKKIVCCSDNILLDGILKEVSDKKKIDVNITKNNLAVRIKENLPYTIELGKRFKFKLRKRLSKAYIRKLREADILIITYTSQFKKGNDTYIGEVIDEFREKSLSYKIIDIDYTSNIINIANGIKERGKYGYIPFEYFLEDNKEAKNVFRRKWDYLKDKESFINSLNYRGLSFWEIMKEQFEFIFKHRFCEAANFVLAAEKMFEALKPKIIFLHDETSNHGRSIILSARMKGIKTFALQHGLICDESFEYINKEEENNELQTPVSDLTFVMGSFTKELLTKKSNYNADNVIISGQPRYDLFNENVSNTKQLGMTPFLKAERDVENNELIGNKLKRKKRIVLIGQPLIEEECGDYVQTVFDAYSELQKTRKDIELVIKLHPREEVFKFYKDLSEKYKINTTIVKEIPILDVLKNSDIVITMHSTVGIEALMLGKPLIIVNTTGKDDMYPYASDKETPKCRDKYELLNILKRMERLKPALSFLEYHLFLPKGGSAKKISEFIINELNAHKL